MYVCHMVVQLQHELGALETWRQQRGCSVRTRRSIKFPFILRPSSERCVFTENNQAKTVCIRVAAVPSCTSVLIDFIKLKSRTDGFLAWISNERDISDFMWVWFWGRCRRDWQLWMEVLDVYSEMLKSMWNYTGGQ